MSVSADNIPTGILEQHWGYIYQITYASGDIYIGQHKHRSGESFDSYNGSGADLQPSTQLEKKLLRFVRGPAEADFEEIRAIVLAKAIRRRFRDTGLRNIAIGGRKPVEQLRYFEAKVDRRVTASGWYAKCARLFLESSPMDRRQMVKDLDAIARGETVHVPRPVIYDWHITEGPKQRVLRCSSKHDCSLRMHFPTQRQAYFVLSKLQEQDRL